MSHEFVKTTWNNGASPAITAEQLNRIEDAIDESIGAINDLETGKQDELTFDSTPTVNSQNPVTSGGIKQQLDLKADLASPVFTGTPKAPTPSRNATDQIATAEFVNRIVEPIEQYTNELSETILPEINNNIDDLDTRADALEIDTTDLQSALGEITEGDTEYVYTPLPYTPVAIDRTRQGIHFVQSTDGTVTASGTNDGTGSSFWGMQDASGIHYFTLSASKTYRLTGCPAGGGEGKYDVNIRTSSSGSLFIDTGEGVIFSPAEDGQYQVVARVYTNYAVSGTITFTPLLEERTEVVGDLTAVDKVARNDIDEITEEGSQYIYTPLTFDAINFDRTRQGIHFIQSTDGTVTASGTNDGSGSSLLGLQDANGIHFFELSASKTYRLTGCPAGGDASTKYDINIRKAEGGTLFADIGEGVIFTPPDDDLYQIVVAVRKNYAISGTLTFQPLLEERVEVQGELSAIDRFARRGYGLFNNTVVTPQMFGAVADGIADDSRAVITADAFSASVLFFPPGVYNLSGVTAHKSWVMSDGAWITTTDANSTVVTIAGNNNTYRLNCRFTGINPYWGVDVTGNNNHIEQFIVDGMTYDGNTQPYGSCALMIHGNNNTVDFARFKDFVQSNPGNDSAPQCIATLETATGNHFADIYSNNCRATFVNAAGAGTRNSIGVLKSINAHDNGVYNVRGGHIDVGILDHEGTDEGFVVITDSGSDLSSATVGTLICKDCAVAIRIKNSGDVQIGQAFLQDCGLGIRLDLNNVESKSLVINALHIMGAMGTAMYLSADGLRGKLDRLCINELMIDHTEPYDTAQASDLNNYIDVSAVDEVYFGKCYLQFSASDYGTGDINMVLNSAPVKQSYIGECKVRSTHALSISPVGQALMRIANGLLANGGVTVDGSGAYDDALYSASAPQSGTWVKGQTIYATGNSVAEYRCVASGTPGTWKSVPLT